MRVTVLAVSVALLGSAGAAQVDWRGELVKIEGREMVYDEVSLCHFKPNPPAVGETDAEPQKFQVRASGRVPATVISRDRFVQLMTGMEFALVVGMAESGSVKTIDIMERLKCEPLRKPIGSVDLDLKVQGTAEGYQVEIAAAGKSSRVTRKWRE